MDSIPFQSLTDLEFLATCKGIENSMETLEDICCTSTSLRSFFHEINKTNPFENDPLNKHDASEDDAFLINCKYIDICSYNLKTDPNKFSIFHTNIGSIEKHIEELRSTLISLPDFKFDVIAITETKIKKNTKPKVCIQIKGYKCYHVDTESEKGYSLIYISDTINSKPRHDLEAKLYKSELLESTVLEIINPKAKNIIITCLYRHPSMDLKEFNEDFLTPYLSTTEKEKKKHFIAGDFNVDLLKMDDESNYSTFFDVLTSNLFVPHIIHPTRITPTSKTLIDNIFSNCLNFQEGKSGNFTLKLSDHLAQFLVIPITYHQIPKKKVLYTYDTKNFDGAKFLEDFQNIAWPTTNNMTDPNIPFDDMMEKIDKLVNTHLPKRKMTQNEIRRKQKPWINNEILRKIKKRDKTHGKYLKSNDESKKNELLAKYKDLRKEVTTLVKNSKIEHYQNLFSENSNDLRTTWRGIKSIININSRETISSTALKINDKISNEPSEVANEFNTYYKNVAKDLQDKIHTVNQNFESYLTESHESSFFLSPTNPFEVLDTINLTINNKSTGPNSIPNCILDLIKTKIAGPLSNIFNLSFSTGIYLNQLKLSRIVLIYKGKGDEFLPKNYRPISLLSNINKLFEKLMHKRLYKFFEDHNLFYIKQFGFRLLTSTVHSLFDLTEDIRQGIDDNKFVCGIFVDLQKAFDTVDHNILLKKLEHYGIRGIANQWFNSYLCKRRQYVNIQGSDSDISEVALGVPQGSVLGPLLFLIYINDLHKAIKFSTPRLFADDTNLLLKNHSLKKLQKQINYDLRQLYNWLVANKISLNSDKTELIIFHNPKKKINYDLKIKLNGKKLTLSNYVKYLGILLDPHLNWGAHINVLSAKLNRAAGMLAKIRHFVTSESLRNIYFSIFSSLMTYASQIWGQFPNNHVKRIQKIQNRALRIINFSNFDASSTPLYYKSDILKFSDHVRLQNFLHVHRDLKENSLPLSLRNNFKLISDVTEYPPTRMASTCKLFLPIVRTVNYGINSITYRSVCDWNSFTNSDPSIEFHKLSKFICKKHIKNYIMSTYNV